MTTQRQGDEPLGNEVDPRVQRVLEILKKDDLTEAEIQQVADDLTSLDQEAAASQKAQRQLDD